MPRERGRTLRHASEKNAATRRSKRKIPPTGIEPVSSDATDVSPPLSPMSTRPTYASMFCKYLYGSAYACGGRFTSVARASSGVCVGGRFTSVGRPACHLDFRRLRGWKIHIRWSSDVRGPRGRMWHRASPSFASSVTNETVVCVSVTMKLQDGTRARDATGVMTTPLHYSMLLCTPTTRRHGATS